MKKRLIGGLLISLTMLSACQINNSDIVNDNDANVITSNSIKPESNIDYFDMPSPFVESPNTGSDSWTNYYQPCNRKLDNIPTELLWLAPQDELNIWTQENSVLKKAPTNLNEYPNVYSFIVKFNISDDDVWEALNTYLISDDPQISITEEDVNIILSRDEESIVEHFASDYSITVEDNIYSPQWIYTHNVDEYTEAGISSAIISGMAKEYRNIDFSTEATDAFENKLSNYTGQKVQLKSTNNIPKLYNIEVDGKTFDLEWLTAHTIQDYIAGGITVDQLQQLLNSMPDNNTPEYEWIYSCMTRMAEDSNVREGIIEDNLLIEDILVYDEDEIIYIDE